MRWARDTTRRDSERPMSLRWDAGEPTEPEPGDLSVLQLLLQDGGRRSVGQCSGQGGPSRGGSRAGLT